MSAEPFNPYETMSRTIRMQRQRIEDMVVELDTMRGFAYKLIEASGGEIIISDYVINEEPNGEILMWQDPVDGKHHFKIQPNKKE